MQGTIIECSQYWQWKLDSIANWYFDYMMELLPLMLQAALLLLGCALSCYLWEINTTIASVVLGVTLFSLLFYLFIVVVGTFSMNCPYQTPGADFLHHILNILSYIPYMFYHIQDIICPIWDVLCHVPHIFWYPLPVFGMLHSLFHTSVKESICLGALTTIGDGFRETCNLLLSISTRLSTTLFFHILPLPLWLVVDACRVMV